ncbi:hypothetical protein [Goodfellowiella coeruleoviolacea]|uniref:Uncharacterized protein n=1 Tax=Goodfellowiella coeruleoviolacea TaxID=334858 RepID=A0AAE3GGD7_9PSEU|nr:hypothetical protein [Goodfellowiella coeruleoviolacea]MCP2165643.1 hypothetical protein [Goodfellowiella coeruleoviolacea]
MAFPANPRTPAAPRQPTPRQSVTTPAATAPAATTPAAIAPHATAARPRWWRYWPGWAPPAAAAWGVLHAALQLGWVATGTTVPWTAHTPYPPAVQLLLAGLAVLAATAALASTRQWGRPGRTAVASVLVVALPVFGSGMVGLPVHLVPLATGAGLESATGLAQVLSHTVGTGLLALVAVAHRRRLRGRCPRCGLAHPDGTGTGPLVHPAAATAPARTRVAVYLLMCGLLPWAGVKTVWTLGGDALGVTAEAWHAANADAAGLGRALASVGIDVTVLAALLVVVLLLGLTHRWGQVFPRWTLVLAGRRVPRLLPLLPAWLTAVGLSAYGAFLVVLAPLSAVGVLPRLPPAAPFTTASGMTWMVEFGGLAFAGLGFGLVVAARSYAVRTRPRCATTTAPATTAPAPTAPAPTAPGAPNQGGSSPIG